jgi:acetyl esterase/lipase
MASKQSLANKAHHEAWAGIVAKTPLKPEEQIEWNDIHWTALTAEPGGVDYVEVNAGGIAAMWILPKGSVEDRVILYSHGGGFVSGSIYTHREMVGHLAKAVGSRALLFDYPYAHQKKYPAQLDTAGRCLSVAVGPADRTPISTEVPRAVSSEQDLVRIFATRSRVREIATLELISYDVTYVHHV